MSKTAGAVILVLLALVALITGEDLHAINHGVALWRASCVNHILKKIEWYLALPLTKEANVVSTGRDS